MEDMEYDKQLKDAEKRLGRKLKEDEVLCQIDKETSLVLEAAQCKKLQKWLNNNIIIPKPFSK